MFLPGPGRDAGASGDGLLGAASGTVGPLMGIERASRMNSVRLLYAIATSPPRATAQFIWITRLRGCDSGSHCWIAKCGQFDSADGDGWSKHKGPVWELFRHIAVVVMAPYSRQARATALVNDKFWHAPSPVVMYSHHTPVHGVMAIW